MGRLSRPAKLFLSLVMTPVLIGSLYTTWSAPRDAGRQEGADPLAVRLILLDLYSLELSSVIDPSLRQKRLHDLAARLNVEASRSPGDAVLQAENTILQMEAGGYDPPAGEEADLVRDLEIPDPNLARLMRVIYLDHDGSEPLDRALFTEIMGESWFSLRAIIQYEERRGDPSGAAELKARLRSRASVAVTRLGRLGLIVGGGAVTGLILWGRYFLVVRPRGVPRREQLLSRADWNGLDGYFLFLLFFCLLLGAAWLLALLLAGSEGLGLSAGSAVPLLYLLQALAGLLILQRFFFPGRLFDSIHRMGGALGGGPARQAVAWGLGGYAATLPLVLGVLFLSSWVMGRPPVSSNPLIPLIMEATTAGEKLLFFITVAVLAPAFEEIFFRGFLFNAFRATLGTAAGMVLSSLLFGLIHFDFAMVPGLFAIGMMLCFVYYHTQSLAAPMLLHGLWNATTLITVQTLFP